ncbi:hypothetical protein I5J75_35250, partial [Pseudomonas aeruginosa]|nr:hypothetical protein [Pseudomonas aeruginosa]MBH8705355.1 hypothetical protein [Pseudomonas aeruginosa]
MKERPILFSGPMVRAILEGRKTVTRRIAKPVKHPDLGNIYAPGALVLEHEPQHVVDRACPYGQPGDRLWVRETWTDVNMCGAPALAYRADEDIRDLMEEPGFLDDRGAFNYDDPRVKPYPFACWYAELDQARWRPSIHMPRWASRILLEITSVRVERLQDISEEQAIAEGPPGLAFPAPPGSHWVTEDGRRRAFMRLWDDVNGAGAWD